MFSRLFKILLVQPTNQKVAGMGPTKADQLARLEAPTTSTRQLASITTNPEEKTVREL